MTVIRLSNGVLTVGSKSFVAEGLTIRTGEDADKHLAEERPDVFRETTLSYEQLQALQAQVKLWREPAERVGCLHAYWDLILDAECLLKGTQPFLRGSTQEVYEILMKSAVTPQPHP